MRRNDAKPAKVDAFHSYTGYMMPKRTEREVYINKEVDVTELVKYLEKRNEGREKNERITLFHCFVTAIGRTIKMRPLLNRFIANKHYWDRNEISMSFVAKKRFEDHAEEALMILKLRDDNEINSISKKIIGDVKQARKEGENFGADGALEVLAKLPSPIMSFVMWVLCFLDRHGMFPKSFRDVDPNYTTVLISNLGSIKCDAIHHHLNDFGTNSIMITIGVLKKKEKIMDDGSKEIRDIIEVGCTLDEMIGDGFYFAKSLRIIDYLMAHPEELEIPMSEEINYVCD